MDTSRKKPRLAELYDTNTTHVWCVFMLDSYMYSIQTGQHLIFLYLIWHIGVTPAELVDQPYYTERSSYLKCQYVLC